MRMALIQCPPWDINAPPLGIAYLDSYLSSRGYKVFSYDINIELYNLSKNKRLWEVGHKYSNFWKNNEKVRKFLDGYLKNFVEKITQKVPQLVGFSVANTNLASSLIIAEKLKQKDKNIKIVFGGPECSLKRSGKFIIEKKYIDAVVFGEGELVFYNLLKGLENKGKFIKTKGAILKEEAGTNNHKKEKLIEDIDSLSFPNFDSFDLSKYKIKNSLPIVNSRGCINNCIYCSERKFWEFYRFRKAEEVFREIKRDIEKYHTKTFFFNDSIINGNLKELEKLCDLIIKEKIKINWNGNAMIRKDMNYKLLKKMHKAGCTHLIYGVENASDHVLKLMKRNYDSKLAQKVLRETYKAGIQPVANWIIGFPGEIKNDFISNLVFLIRNRRFFKVSPVSTFKVLNDTDIMEKLNDYNIILDDSNFADGWKTKDNKNTPVIRERRLKIFNIFLTLLKMRQ